MSYEQIVLLAIALAQGEALQLRRCTTCGRTALIDRLAVDAHRCSQCDDNDASS